VLGDPPVQVEEVGVAVAARGLARRDAPGPVLRRGGADVDRQPRAGGG
jgi:hypothetical protein